MEICYIADAWQRLIIDVDSPQSIALSMVIHRMTGYKEAANILSRAGFVSSYTNVYRETKKPGDDARNYSSFTPVTIPKEQPTHVTIDKFDGR